MSHTHDTPGTARSAPTAETGPAEAPDIDLLSTATAPRNPHARGAVENDRARRSGRSITELVNDLVELVPRLIRDELALALAEMRDKGRSAGRGAGLFGGGGVVAFYGGGALVAAAVLGLAEALAAWLAALIIGSALLAVGGLLALVARRQLNRALPPAPRRTIESVRDDVATVRRAAARS